jgi:hypothetical protein
MNRLIMFLMLTILSWGQTTSTSEIRFKAKVRPSPTAGHYKLVVNSATGQLSCVAPDGSECFTTGTGAGLTSFTMPSPFTVAGVGTSSISITFANVGVNQIWAGPSSGGSGVPAFRLMSLNDLPTLTAAYIPNLDATKITTGTLPINRGGTGLTSVTADAINVGNISGSYTPTSLCTGVLSYSLTTHSFSCNVPGGGAASLSANTFVGVQTINPSGAPIDVVILKTDPVVGAGWNDSHAVNLTGTANDGTTAYDPQIRYRNDVVNNTGGAEWRMEYRRSSSDSWGVLQRITSNGRMFLPTYSTQPPCAAADYWIGADTTLGVARKCLNGAVTDMDTAGSGGGSGTVTSVGMTVPGVIFASPVSGSPITTSGTFALALATQVQKTFLAGPTSGADATPTFRTIASADLPATIAAATTGNAATATALAANGSNCSAGSVAAGVDASGAAEGCSALPVDNGQLFYGYCSGTATSSTTITMPPFGTANAASCSSTFTGNELPMEFAGTITVFRAKAGTGGSTSTSGTFTLYKNGSATAITCAIGTGTTCNDTTHTVSFVAGDTIGVRFTTSAAETLANVRMSFWYH